MGSFTSSSLIVWLLLKFTFKKMLIYQDLFTGKDILTDSYKMKLVDDFYFEIQAKYITRKGESFGDDMFGGNPSAEEASDDLEEGKSTSGFDVIINHEDVEEYNEEPNYKTFLGVMKKIIAKAGTKMDKERHTAFKQKLNVFFKDGPASKDKFKNFQIFFSKDYIDLETGDIIAAPIFVDADDTGMEAKIYYLKDLMEEIKA